MTGRSPATILVVDDDEDIVELLEKGISSLGNYRIVSAISGSEALAIIAKELPDLVLLDIMMEGLDGTQVCRAIKGDERTAHIPVIALTVIHKIDKKRYEDIMDSGVDEYITKPFSFVELNKVIVRHVELSKS